MGGVAKLSWVVRILHVIHSVDPRGGGPIEGIRQLSAPLVAQGHRVEVLSLDPPGTPWSGDLPFHPVGNGHAGFGYARGVVDWLIGHADDYDITLVNGLWQYGGLAVWRAARKTRRPYGVFTHGMLDPWFKRRYPLKHLKKWLYWPWGEYRVLRDAAAVLFTCEQERRDARESFWLYRANEKVLGFGITAPPEDAAGQLSAFHAKFPALAKRRLLLFLGRLHEKKGCDLLLRAFARIPADTHLVMAGPADSPYADWLKQLARELGIADRVTWTGMISGDVKWGAFRAAEAFVLPSHQENFGISVVEALACRCPVLISDKVNIWREITADGAGLIGDDTQEATDHLLAQWLALPSTERSFMAGRARACFERHFQVEGVSQHLIDILHPLTTA
jgi:glycosyltransferase involved in cell wall biosynthesis